jgi:hypothetical protein
MWHISSNILPHENQQMWEYLKACGIKWRSCEFWMESKVCNHVKATLRAAAVLNNITITIILYTVRACGMWRS